MQSTHNLSEAPPRRVLIRGWRVSDGIRGCFDSCQCACSPHVNANSFLGAQANSVFSEPIKIQYFGEVELRNASRSVLSMPSCTGSPAAKSERAFCQVQSKQVRLGQKV